MTVKEFGMPVPNDWPIQVDARFMLSGCARDYWYVNNSGRSPVFRTELAAARAIGKLYREFGHLVTSGQCTQAYNDQRIRSLENTRSFRLAMARDGVEIVGTS